MRTNTTFRAIALLLSFSLTLNMAAQKINKVAALQKQNGTTVLKSSDSRLPQTLAYFDHEVSLADVPQEFRDFLQSYEEAARLIGEGADPAAVLSVGVATTADSVGPLLGDIEFDQGTPYNDKCPYLNNGKAVTGCVATAMAQIMTFHQYPAVGKGTATYTGTGGATTYNFAEHPFDWANILHTYKGGSYNQAQANAIAELMLACGASVNMNYNVSESGANSQFVKTALRDIFGYDESIYYAYNPTEDARDNVWPIQLKRQFDAGHPVYYAGGDQTSGHAFVMDGYKVVGDKTYFHVNWGWSGRMNGWFLISKLNPGGTNYSAYRNDMVFNIFPPGAGVENTKDETAFKINFDQPVYTILGNKIPATGMEKGMIYIQNGHKFVW